MKIRWGNPARKGDWLCCWSWHKICRFKEHTSIGQLNWGMLFVDWQQAEPRIGGKLPLCKQCGMHIFELPPKEVRPWESWLRSILMTLRRFYFRLVSSRPSKVP